MTRWRFVGYAVVLGLLAAFFVTYPRPAGDGVVMPPGQGVYENYENYDRPPHPRSIYTPPGWTP